MIICGKWSPKSSKYVCNSLSRLWCKLLQIQCSLNPVTSPLPKCLRVPWPWLSPFMPQQMLVIQLQTRTPACLLRQFDQNFVNWTFRYSWAGRSLRNWAFWFHSVSLVPWFRIHLSLNSTIFVAKSWELIPKVKEWFEYSLYEYFGNLQEARCFPAQTNFFYSIWIVFNSTKLNSRHFVFGELWVKTYNTNITVSEYIQSIEIGRCRIEICRKVPI